MLENNQNQILWVVDPKGAFDLVESMIAKNIVVQKFTSVRGCELFLKDLRILEKQNPGKKIVYPDCMFFFLEVNGRRLKDMSSSAKLIQAIKEKNPATNDIAFCAITRMQDQLLKAGFTHATRFEGGDTVKSLIGGPSV